MIRRSPAEHYLKYLVVHPDAHTNDQIREIVGELQLDFVGNAYIDRLRSGLTAPTPFYPAQLRHTSSQRFLIKERIQGLFHPDEDTKRALEVLEKPRVKEFVEAMSLSGAPPQAIAYGLRSQRQFSCTSVAVERYQHYFWNLQFIDSTDTRALLQMRLETAASSKDPEIQAQLTALKKARYNDPRVIAADLPASPLTALMSQMRMGLMPSSGQLSQVLETLRTAAAIRALEATLSGGPDDSVRALNFSGVVRVATETLEQVARPDEELNQKLGALLLRTEPAPVPLIHQLSQGQHTVEMQPISKESHAEESSLPPSDGPAAGGA